MCGVITTHVLTYIGVCVVAGLFQLVWVTHHTTPRLFGLVLHVSCFNWKNYPGFTHYTLYCCLWLLWLLVLFDANMKAKFSAKWS